MLAGVIQTEVLFGSMVLLTLYRACPYAVALPVNTVLAVPSKNAYWRQNTSKQSLSQALLSCS